MTGVRSDTESVQKEPCSDNIEDETKAGWLQKLV